MTIHGSASLLHASFSVDDTYYSVDHFDMFYMTVAEEESLPSEKAEAQGQTRSVVHDVYKCVLPQTCASSLRRAIIGNVQLLAGEKVESRKGERKLKAKKQNAPLRM